MAGEKPGFKAEVSPSASVPPMPRVMSGPKALSARAPSMSSWPKEKTAWGTNSVTRIPSASLNFDFISESLAVASALAQTLTPPDSVLCRVLWEETLSTTLSPGSGASRALSSDSGRGMRESATRARFGVSRPRRSRTS